MHTPESLQHLLAPLFPGLLGMRIDEVGAERVKASLPVREGLCTVGGILHGGALMALADTLGAIGAFVNLPEGKRTTTIESSTKFVGAARAGTTVSAECVVLHRGRTTTVWQTSVYAEDGRLCAIVSQTQLTLDA
ncbi:MAG TPA: PaaI family thioesterase [Noviherbaspirillum sp.]|nr:PaaI family thioesterase [Noviherbaspirillum sp.]